MQARIRNAASMFPDAVQALRALGSVVEQGGVPERTLGLVHLRASQINGCAVCLDLHTRHPRYAHETGERLLTIAGWRDAPYFTDAERAALALTEAVTRIADQADPVPDAIWDEAARHYDERALVALVLSIGLTNVFNRLNVATRQVAGEWATSPEGRRWLESREGASKQDTTTAAV